MIEKEAYAPLDDETERVLIQLAQAAHGGPFGWELLEARKRIRELLYRAIDDAVINNRRSLYRE